MQPTMCYQCGINPGTRQNVIMSTHKHGGIIRETKYSTSSTNVLICEMCELKNSLPRITMLFIIVNLFLILFTFGIWTLVTVLMIYLKFKKKKQILLQKENLISFGLKPTF
ncbi:hypothetical protein STIUS_v1c02940 [Spiroplasma sp. TIUS-1]|uniref:hypothetical protein n=1 Tax=Spiroplasma sp. TIUS-1 TaxID=216963 RepID=UPI0013977AF8|nr:hypothetical protein [Spiroplasma sp. TIUS-1]QHX35848.1 hypothetical protein STIUS_v1c02940 [Spiroplasma sp. TIUS-1]